MTTYQKPTIEVFVTTYKTVNETGGYSTGKWFDLSDYENKQQFNNAAIDYARNELNDPDPELCYPVWESSIYDLGYKLVSEDGIDPQAWDVLELEEYQAEIIDAYLSIYGKHKGVDILDILQRAESAYFGYYQDTDDFVIAYLENNYPDEIANMPSIFYNNLNLAHVYEDIRHDFNESNGHYFYA